MKKFILVGAALALMLGLLLQALPSSAQEPQRQEAPKLTAPVKSPPIINGHGTGFVPPPMDLSHLTGQRMPSEGVSAENVSLPPASFDWRTQGKVTPVKAQGACGACYAFASIGNIESKLLIDGAGTYNFSENNAKECNWYETSGINGGDNCIVGGNCFMMASLFSKKGLVLESCDPYVASDVACKATCPYQITLLDWRIICGGVVPNTDVLKTYIQTRGPVYTTMYAGHYDPWDTEFTNYNGSYTLYYTGTQATNHAVLIVGWNDSLVHAGGSGGWIVKNSWGTEWGGTCGYGSEKGYFTIAYGSASIGMSSSFMYDWQDYDSGGGIMFYDEGGWFSSVGYGSTTAWGLCKFIPISNTYVTRAEFWTTDVTTDIDVYIYDDFDGANLSNLLAQKLNNSFNEAGYHSVALDMPLLVTAGDDVIAVVKFTNSSSGFPIAIDDQGPYETQRTYSSSDGSKWHDEASWKDDVAIRLRTSALTPSPPSVTTSDATNKTANSATLHGNLSSKGTAPTVYASFQYGPTAAYGNETTPQAMTTTGSFSFNLSSLSPNTTCHFRAKAVGDGTSYGLDKSFTTLPPGVVTATATRDIFTPTLAPGGTTQITVTFTSLLTQANAFALKENIPSGWTFTRGTDDASAFKESTHEWVWFSVVAGATKTVTYSLTALNDAEGDYSISGTVLGDNVENPVGGDNTVIVSLLDILAYYRAYLGDPDKVETQELLKAANDWANGVTPPGFNEPITTVQLLMLANEWAAG